MTLWYLFALMLIVTISISSIYCVDSTDMLNPLETIAQIPSNSRSSSFIQQDHRVIVKRSQNNANILYRHCRRLGQPPQFCLKYAIRMLFATGH